MVTLHPNSKRIRARVIKEHMQQAGYRRAVCFTCGNAAAALRAAGVDVLEVGGNGPLEPTRWWSPAEIRAVWPECFDATPGHLPLELLACLAVELRAEVGALEPGTYHVPTGSGETLCAMRLAYPHCTVLPVCRVDGLLDATTPGPSTLARVLGLLP